MSFEEKVAFVYDVAPKVRIAGKDFDTLDASTLKLNFAPKLKKGTDYKLEIQSSTAIVLTLQENKRWAKTYICNRCNSPRLLFPTEEKKCAISTKHAQEPSDGN